MKCVTDVVVVLTALWLTPCDVTITYSDEPASVKGVCDAQCEALCQEIPDRVNECESLCQPGTPRKWIFNCQDRDCKTTGYCSILEKQSVPAVYIPPKPVLLKPARDPKTKSILLGWQQADNQTAHKVIYIVQWAFHAAPTEERMWYTQGWTIREPFFVDEMKDACVQPWFRVAAVSRYGSRWYSDPVLTPALVVAGVAGPVRNIHISPFTYHADTKETTFNLYWKEPDGWGRNDIISYYWTYHLDQPCHSISGQGVPVFFDSQSPSNHAKVLKVRMPIVAIGCKFNFQVRAYSTCIPKQNGPITSIAVDVDCHRVNGYPCTHDYNPPGNVENITLYVVPRAAGPTVLLGWSPPSDKGSEGRIAEYHIRWGELIYDAFLGSGYLYNTSTKVVPGNCTWTEITMGNSTSNDSYGVQIIATPPGHSDVGPWLSPVNLVWSNRTNPQNDYGAAPGPSLYTTILKDDNGVVIVLIPKAKGVRVYVTMPEERSKVDLTGFYLHWGRLHNDSQKLTLQDMASIFLSKNAQPYVLLNDLQAERQYGIKVIPYCNDSDDYDVDPEPADDSDLHYFTMPFIKDTDQQKHSFNNTPAVASITVLMAAVVVVLVAVFVYTKKRRKKLAFLERRYARDNDGSTNYYDMDRPDFNGMTSPPVVADSWELPHSCLKLGQILGSGAFGTVVRGQVTYTMLRHREVQVPLREGQDKIHVSVAVKMLQEGVDNRYYRDFIKEINLMKEIGYHVNVVSMLGCCTLREPICLVVEHMALGDLLHYLKNIRHMLYTQDDSTGHYQNREAEHLSPLDILSFARQIVRGMEFLSGKSFVHRDLAARNILVDETKILKIGDFGLTRYIYDDKVYVNRRGGKLPIKWMSVEAIFDQTFSTASDVWSYGIVLFELMTLGGTPYPGISNRELHLELRNGYRMDRPDNCSLEMYQLMRDCWKSNPKERPSFTDIGQRIDTMIADCSGQEYLDLQLDENQDYYQVGSSEDEDSVVDLDLDEGATTNNDRDADGSSKETSATKDCKTYEEPDQNILRKMLVNDQKGQHASPRHEEVLVNKEGDHDIDAAGASSKDTIEDSISSEVQTGIFVDHLKTSSDDSDVHIIAECSNIGGGSERHHKRSMKGYQRDLRDEDRKVNHVQDLIGHTLQVANEDRESDSSYSQLEGSDDVFSDGLYSTPYSYLETPTDMECLPGSDSSPTDSELSDCFFQTDSVSVAYSRKRFRMDRLASEISTTSNDSGLPQSPVQTEFSPQSSLQYLPKYTKNQPKTGSKGKAKLRRLTRNTSFTFNGTSLPSVANSDEDLTSSSL